MTRRLDRLRSSRPAARSSYSFDDWLADAISPYNMFGAGGPGVRTTWGSDKAESIANSFEGYVRSAYKANGVVFAVILARMLLFTEARFRWQEVTDEGRGGALSMGPELDLLETPYTNGTTATLLARMEQDASLAGNWFGARIGQSVRRMRPDWTSIILDSPSGDPDDLDTEPLGYVFWRGGPAKNKPEILMPEQVAHFAPIPDPEAMYRGMSWLTPILREIQSDSAATRHKQKYFENAATPNLAVKLSDKLTLQQFREFVKEMEGAHRGVENAYKTLYLGGGAESTVVGSDFKQLDFKVTQGAGETRIAAAGGVPPVIVGLSEGLQQATYSNYGQARRKFADGWARPQWGSAAGALASILPRRPGRRLWYDEHGIAFLQEDQKDAADILQADATTTKTLVDAGYTPESVVKAVGARDMTLLEHSGLVSVQLQAPGSTPPAAA